VSAASVVAEMVADAEEFLDGRVEELSCLLEDLASLLAAPAPAPSPELALLLTGDRSAASDGRRQRPVPPPVRRGRMLAGLAVAAVSALSITGAAAVANELPPPMQRAVAHFSEQYLPFSFPRPVGDPPADSDAKTPWRTPGTTDGDAGAGARRAVPPSTGTTDPARQVRTPAHRWSGGSEDRAGGPQASGGGSGPAGSGSQGTGSQGTGSQGTGSSGTGSGGTHTGKGSGVGTATAPRHHFAGTGNAGKGVQPATPPGHTKSVDPGRSDTGGGTSPSTEAAAGSPADGAESTGGSASEG
jgi:hypothetical protein